MFNIDGVASACLAVFIAGCSTFGLIGLGIGYWIWG
ncbi:hypothetical protein ZZ1p0040 [Acinetobacter phage ZZ1]|jgi:hypothetical protein|uniref:Uncharacterized protein n=2 Tax=Caudoviricetes TaxID=2731619 RepID=W0AYU1_9CAUD|nr:hypothetical protein ZZ1p0040 [Acinetobacter phage ZZ1]AHE63468.1 hypothetical protein ZZ1p0040 [Acinetobacter phage ZZ1]